MKNDRPVENPELQAALDEVQEILTRHGLAGACMLVSATEAAFTYRMHAPWSAFRPDNTADLGFRLRAKASEQGADVAHKTMEGAAHTVCVLNDFGHQTAMWMEDLLRMMRRAGVEIEHTPFGGKPLPHLGRR